MTNEDVIIGFDPSLNSTGWAVFRGKKPIDTGVIEPEKMMRDIKEFKKLDSMQQQTMKREVLCREVMNLLKKWNPVSVGIEEERVFNSPTAVIVGQSIGCIEACTYCHSKYYGGNIKVVMFNPSTARGLIGVYGRKKSYILMVVRKMFPDIEIKDHNASDAIVIGNATYASYRNSL